MNITKAISATLALLLSLPLISGCQNRKKVWNEEEEAIYMLVGEPCAEGDFTTAIRRADSLLSAPEEMSDTLRAYIMIDRDVSILESGNLDWFDAYADTVIDFGRQHGIGLAVMQGLQHKGIYQRRHGGWNKAISYYKEGLDIAMKEGNDEMQQTFGEMLAIACAEHDLYDEAIYFCRQSADIARQRHDSVQELQSIATLGGIYSKKGDYEAAIKSLLPYHQRAMEQKGIVRVKYFSPLLKSYLYLDSLQRAHEVLAQTYSALEGLPHNSQAYLVAVNTEAILAQKEGRYEDEWRWLLKADTIGYMGSTPNQLYTQRARCLANLRRYKEAYEMQAKATAAADSLRASDNDSRLSELMVEYDSLQKDSDIMRLKSQRLLWALAALACVMIVGIVVVVSAWLARRARRRQERERREEYLRGLEDERQRMARELHDDIAAQLVGLQWQLRSESPDDVEKSLISITRRVRALSHELMPVQFREVDFSDMLTDYVSSLNSVSASRHKITLTDEGSYPWHTLPSETSHELYRMVQEAVRNAITHGCDGEIHIILSGVESFAISITNPVDQTDSSPIQAGAGISSLRTRASIIHASVSATKSGGMFTVMISPGV